MKILGLAIVCFCCPVVTSLSSRTNGGAAVRKLFWSSGGVPDATQTQNDPSDLEDEAIPFEFPAFQNSSDIEKEGVDFGKETNQTSYNVTDIDGEGVDFGMRPPPRFNASGLDYAGISFDGLEQGRKYHHFNMSDVESEGIPIEGDDESVKDVPIDVEDQPAAYGELPHDTPRCFIGVSIECVPPPDSSSKSCEDLLIPEFTSCESAPTELLFKFVGGVCNPYDAPQDPDRFMCEDQGEGPAVVDTAETNYIEVFPPDLITDKYFSGNVKVGDTFAIKDLASTPNEKVSLSETMMVLVFADESKEELLQTMIFHTTCNNDISLGDQYGSLMVAAFTNADLEATMIKKIPYEVKISNRGYKDVHIDHVVNVSDQEIKDLLSGGSGPTLGDNSEETIVESMEVDLMHPRMVAAAVTVSGYDEEMNSCSAFAQFVLTIPGLNIRKA